MDEKKTAKVVFVTTRKDDCTVLSNMLRELEYEVSHHICSDLNGLKSYCGSERSDLILYWHKENLIDDHELTQFVQTEPSAPSLVLVCENPTPHDYVQAASMSACDVISPELSARFPFVVLREIHNARHRRKFIQAMHKLEQDYIVDETEFNFEDKDETGMALMVTTIDDALKAGHMELLFQPILSIQDDGHDNYEVFLRIKQKDGYLMPDKFLPVAEQYGLLPAIDRWVVKNAITRFKAEEAVRKLKRGSRQVRFFINISGHSLVDEVIMGHIITEIVKAKLQPGNIVIEVHRNTILSRLQKVKSLNQSIKKLKLEFAINHYVESDKSLNYLKHVELDYIKLDKELIDGMRDPAKRDSIREILQTAHEHNIKIVASQVEDSAVLPMLYDVGVDYIQGYLVAEPSVRLERPIIDASAETAAMA
jgi:EAL domain-containing protein (putative c-di-GMP-specific phosphodiesterase class I)